MGGQVDSLLKGLLRAKGMPAAMAEPPLLTFESALALGDVWALDQLWRELGFDTLAGVFRKARYTTPIEHAIRVMVFNRLCDADSKLGVLRWLQTVSMPQVDNGMAKEGLIARQFMLGVVQTAEGLPIYHEVFDGNQAESPTLMPTLKKVLARFGHIKRLIVVADRGLLSLDNIDELGKITLPNSAGGQALEFILAVPGRRYSEFVEVLQDFQAKAAKAEQEIIEELPWQGLRLVVAHHPERAKEQTQLRSERIAALEAQAQAWAGKLDGQDGAPDGTKVGRGR